ncbi:hypothetical protein [Rhabdochlamydiaceae symbiont of Dictyostelium giganteum]|uniref:hypothetical protein n=1 Tax=Rhabdochlamydiaceae symbiont of Dictyostelium giganteum TaxID=3342349 RepID=UPI00384EB779
MKPKSLVQNQDQLFKTRLSQMINPDHELCKLAASIPWQTLEEKCAEYFKLGVSRPLVPTRVVIGVKSGIQVGRKCVLAIFLRV